MAVDSVLEAASDSLSSPPAALQTILRREFFPTRAFVMISFAPDIYSSAVFHYDPLK
jgi:hypothetical protein